MSLRDLYKKIDDFDHKNASTFRPSLACKKGCSKCCYVDLSVFQIEADHIRDFFYSLDYLDQTELINSWAQHTEGCVFLVKDSCTIYQARPLICRTQGFPLTFQVEARQYVDICPLNEEVLKNVSSDGVMNLDLVNLILSQLESVDGLSQERPRVSLSDLRNELIHSSTDSRGPRIDRKDSD
jgi:Fe-S-cluster containining protein